MRYYDMILCGIFASLSLGATAGFLTSLPLNLTVGAGAAVAAGFMYHGMFQNAPVMATMPTAAVNPTVSQ